MKRRDKSWKSLSFMEKESKLISIPKITFISLLCLSILFSTILFLKKKTKKQKLTDRHQLNQKLKPIVVLLYYLLITR